MVKLVKYTSYIFDPASRTDTEDDTELDSPVDIPALTILPPATVSGNSFPDILNRAADEW